MKNLAPVAGFACFLFLPSSWARAQEAVVEDLRYSLGTFDGDGDGRVSREEFRGEDVDFMRLDLDRDGVLTRDDLARAVELAVEPEDPATVPDGPAEEDAGPEPLEAVFDQARDARADLLVLAGGDEIKGRLETEAFSFVTVYGRVRLPRDRVAGLDLEAREGAIDRAVLVNGDRVSGICADRSISFLPAGTTRPIEVRREKILRVVRRLDPAELEGLPRRQYLVLANGDGMSGRLVTGALSLATPYGAFDLDLARIDRIEMAGGPRAWTVVHTLEGETLSGVFSPEDLEVELDFLAGTEGESLAIHACRIATLFAREGHVPDLAGAGGSAAALVWDFEEGPELWTVSGGQTTWYHTRAEAASGTASFECAASGVLAYGNSANAILLGPPIDLSRMANPFLSFQRKVQTEEGYDFLRAEISYDGGTNWLELASYSGDLPWERMEFPLTPGATSVRIRFRFQSDDSEAQRGVWVDRVEIGTR